MDGGRRTDIWITKSLPELSSGETKTCTLKLKFKISVETVKPFGCSKQVCILQLPIPYCVSIIMVTLTRHVFINIFQMEHIYAVKFAMGYEKNMSFFVIPKSPKVFKKVEKIGLGFFK